jgi:DNA-binding Lrp family transcriptional regulator
MKRKVIARKDVLKKLQSDFPLVDHPFEWIGREMGLSEAEALAYFKKLKKDGILRYIGMTFDLRKLGVISTLVAMRVPKKQLAKTVAVINAYPQVSHNYLRSDDYNVWFTLSTASAGRQKTILAEIRKRTGIDDMLNLGTRHLFKSRAVFEV